MGKGFFFELFDFEDGMEGEGVLFLFDGENVFDCFGEIFFFLVFVFNLVLIFSFVVF